MTTLSKLLAAAAAVGAIGAAGAVLAQGGTMRDGPRGPGGGVEFEAIDANADGALARDELTARATARIVVLDLNADGQLDRAEIIEAAPERGGLRNVFGANPAEEMADRMLAMHGGTASGAVAVATLADAEVNRLLTRLDTNRDDALSLAEAEAAQEQRRGDRGPHRGGPRG